MNQTTMMHKIAHQLPECDCWFTPYYTDGLLAVLERNSLIDFTVAGQKVQHGVLDYCKSHELPIDHRGTARLYDLIVTCSDLFIPKNVRRSKIVLVQEGMTDPENFAYYLVKYLGLPRYLASTSTTGLSDAYVRFCVASEGYRDHFVRKGANAEKIVVTGIPNFDNCEIFRALPFEHRNYTLVATSDARETFKYENRKKFVEKCLRIAGDSTLIFKLHPNEIVERAEQEIEMWAPSAIVYHGRPIEPMIAHCDQLITRYSTVVYIGIALGKSVFSEFDLNTLRAMAPIQNDGTSSYAIADVCRSVLRQERSYHQFSIGTA
ncbi:hypothetical protein BH10BAC6_BH10BAC6_04790 [soil metagenome]